MDIFTIGHSTLTKETFTQLLHDAKIDLLIDVRAFPGSRKYPHFHKDRMKEWLPEANINYQHIKELGGRRNKSKTVDEEVNAGWINRSFHNYADYTLEPEFQDGLKQLKEAATEQKVAYCCSERHPARCHRMLISNWLALHDWHVRHILVGANGQTVIETHELGKWGAPPVLREDGAIVYPKT